jgi:hypothetical protein
MDSDPCKNRAGSKPFVSAKEEVPVITENLEYEGEEKEQ